MKVVEYVVVQDPLPAFFRKFFSNMYRELQNIHIFDPVITSMNLP